MINNRKILFAHDSYLFRKNENEYYGIHLDNRIKERYLNLGDRVSFMMRLKKVEIEDRSRLSQIESENFNFIEVPDFKSISGFIKKFTTAKRIVFEAVSNHDVLVARLPSAIGRLAVLAARKYGVPYIIECVGCTFDAYWNYNWKGKMIAHYKMWQQKRLVKKAPYTIYVTRSYLQKMYPTKGQSIHCSNVELQPIQEKSLLDRIEKIQQSDNRKLILGTVAAIDVPYKGQDDVIKAIGKLKEEGFYVQYKIVGQGRPKRLKSLITKYNVKDRVEILGGIKHKDVFDFLKGIDVYIQPSKQEGLPRALIEAMSEACPSLGASTAGIPELLSEECIFKPSSVPQIVEKIKMVNDQWLVEQAKRNFNVSKEYLKPVLHLSRLSFYQEFLRGSNLNIPKHLNTAILELKNEVDNLVNEA